MYVCRNVDWNLVLPVCLQGVALYVCEAILNEMSSERATVRRGNK